MKTKTLIALAAILAALVVLLAGHWSSGRAEPIASITLPPPGATKDLYPGCNNIVVTFSDGTSSDAVIDAVSPPDSVEAMWRYDAAQQQWEGFSPAAPAASDLLTVNFLNAVWLCLVGGPPTPTPANTAQAGQTATPTPNAATATAEPGQTATPTPNAATATASAGRTATPGPAGPTPTPGAASSAVSPTTVLTSFSYTMQWTTQPEPETTFTTASGGEFEAGESDALDRVHCAITWPVGGMMDNAVVIPPDAWIDMGEGWTHTTPSDTTVDGDLRWFCPGSSLFWEGFLPLDLAGIPGQPDFMNGVLATRLSLKGVVQSLPILGGIPEGADVQTYDIWVAQDGAWLVALEFDGTVDGEPMRIRVDVTDPNNPAISVEPPM